jgi:hypothetical protein
MVIRNIIACRYSFNLRVECKLSRHALSGNLVLINSAAVVEELTLKRK